MFGWGRRDRHGLEGRMIVCAENLEAEGESDRFLLIYSGTSLVDVLLFEEDMVARAAIERK